MNKNKPFVNPKPSTYFTGIGMFNKRKKNKYKKTKELNKPPFKKIQSIAINTLI